MLFNDKFKPEELRLVHNIINTLIAKTPALEIERKDIENILFLKTWECKKKYRQGSKASFTTYLYSALQRETVSILRYKTRQKRYIKIRIVSLDEKLETDSELTVADTIIDNRPETNILENLILKERIKSALNKLSPPQQNIALLLGKGIKKAELARILNKPRTTLNYEIKKILKVFREEGLDRD